ncbi:HAD family hydrolase [Paenibacillus sp. YN15]|uniref:HAD family hydrolase n=1 Tax=Paenibacillus sp. YN15 TaxID=1742774 RepID=UPI000DCDC273|nr:HAD family hydrolase [Paenibacillus sp. YN15]RAV05628.1 HAD family hydrolase [Paenibacillus sp. YN15]
MSSSRYSTVLFDLDGTLTDPKIGIAKGVQYALAKAQISVDDLDSLECFIGPPLATSFCEFYGFSDTDAQAAVAAYREYYSVTGLYENLLYDGIRELLELLRAQGRKLVVATSKPTVFSKTILEHFEIASYFDEIVGSNLDGTLSEKGEIIAHILEQHQLAPHTTVMIGDRKFDIIGAQANGVDSIAVGYGYGSETELMAAQPTHYVKTVGELRGFFAGEE